MESEPINAIINTAICFARKAAKGPGYFIQCPNKKKGDSNYCGKHNDCINPYSAPNAIIKIVDLPEVTTKIVDLPETTNKIINKEPTLQREKKQLIQKEKDYSKYQNQTEFFNLDDVREIPKELFYEYKEGDKFYAFDIRTLNDYLNSCNELEGYKNPYTHVDISAENAEHIKRRYKKLKKLGVILDGYREEQHFEPEKALEWRCLGLFQRINELGHYSEYKWFWDLKLPQLKKMYVELEDIWNYRADLKAPQKQRILPNYKPFKDFAVGHFNALSNIHKAREILLNEIEKFITLGKPEGKNGNDYKCIGSILVLTSLVEVSPMAAKIMPHLVPMF
jgi:hypothetical protein